jgi:hypothetical protein
MAASYLPDTPMFENPEIAVDDLPRADDVSWLGMDEKFLRRLLTQSGIAMVGLIIGIVFLNVVFRIAFSGDGPPLGYLWLLIPLLAVPLFAWPAVKVPRIGYAIRNKDVLADRHRHPVQQDPARGKKQHTARPALRPGEPADFHRRRVRRRPQYSWPVRSHRGRPARIHHRESWDER